MKPTVSAASTPKPAPKPSMTYRERHPNVVGRVPLALYQRLQAQMEATGQSMGQILRAALDPALRNRQMDYDKGFSDGYEQGKQDFGVTYPCYKCGSPHFVTSEAARADVAEVMPMRGWCCKACPPPPEAR